MRTDERKDRSISGSREAAGALVRPLTRWPRWLALAGAVLLVSLGASCSSGEDRSSAPPGAGAPQLPSLPDLALDPAAASLWLTFDEAAVADGDAFADSSGHHGTAEVETAGGGDLRTVAGPPGRGKAVGFPQACAAARTCPRVLVSVEDSAGLDPGGHDFSFGATIKLEPDETSTGSNVVQKGRFATPGGQWKLQVDTVDGHPSCVVRGTAGSLTLRSPVTVADGRWHRVNCLKDARGVTIEVDGEQRHRDGEVGSVGNNADVRVGSSGIGDGDDQFHGAIDDVVLLVGSE